MIARPDDAVIERATDEGKLRLGGELQPTAELVFGDGFTGTHDPEAVFLAAGGPLRHDPVRGDLHVFDVAPLFAYLAGVAIPDDLPGALPERWIEPEALAARPPRTVDAASLERLPPPSAPAIPDAEVLERLRAMGYVE